MIRHDQSGSVRRDCWRGFGCFSAKHIPRTLLLLVLLFSLHSFTEPAAAGDQAAYSEYKLKSAILYNFLLFTEWSSDESDKSSRPMILGVIGKYPFQKNAFDAVKNSSVKGRPLRIKQFKSDASAEELGQCQILFFPSGTFGNKALAKVLESLKDTSVLTVGEQEGFLKQGGMINLQVLKDRVVFEVSRTSSSRVGIKFRSQMLRLATRVVNGHNTKKGSK